MVREAEEGKTKCVNEDKKNDKEKEERKELLNEGFADKKSI